MPEANAISRGATVLVTGARGFVGRAVVNLLLRAGYHVRATGRGEKPDNFPSEHCTWHRVPDLSAEIDWQPLLDGTSAVIHLAARVHQLRERASNVEAAYHAVNVEGTMHLARQAAQAGVKRFLFASTVKVSGESTGRTADGLWQRFNEDMPEHPQDAYARSKWEAEQRLKALASEGGMSVTILRPPLVYGAGVSANFLRLLRAVHKRWPLPFANIDNLRSLVYVENLAEAMLNCLESSVAANKTYFVSDVDISSADLVTAIARSMGKKPWLVGVPVNLLRLGGQVTFQRASIARLTDSLLVDDSRIRNELFWTPSISMQEGINRTVAWFTGKPVKPTPLPRYARMSR